MARNMTQLSPLNEDQVRAIHSDRRSYKSIAVEYGISVMTVCNIKKGKTWKHLGLTPTVSSRAHRTLEQEGKVHFA